MSLVDSSARPSPARPPSAFEAVLLARRLLAPHIFILRLGGCEPLAMVQAGEFMMLRGAWGRDPLLPRAFSLLDVSVGGDPSVADLLVKTVGRGTRLLEEMSLAARLSVLGPLGRPFPLAEAPRALCVAGGVGLAPLLLFAQQARRRFGAAAQLELHYGGRSAEELVLADECRAVFDRVLLATEDGSAGERGRVTAITERRLVEQPAAVEILACGPTGMMAESARIARQHGVRCLVSLEGPMACGIGLCLGCAVPAQGVPFRYVCLDGPVFDADELGAWT